MKASFVQRIVVVCTLAGFWVTGQAALIERAGGLAYYDDVLGITWLADANLARTSGYHPSGNMSWEETQDWLSMLNATAYLGFDQWRLPGVGPVNGTVFNNLNSFAGDTDIGSNIGAAGTLYEGSTASEMAHLFYVTLGNDALVDKDGLNRIPEPQVNSGPFSNLQLGYSNFYWSGSALTDDPASVYVFYFRSGHQGSFPTVLEDDTFAWAVGAGDIFAVPLPSTLGLLLSGMAGFVVCRPRRASTADQAGLKPQSA